MNEPFAPEGAPRRPVGAQLPSFVFVAMVFAVLLTLGPHPIFKIAGFIGLSFTLGAGSVFWRHANRTSWYEQRPVVAPALPFEMRAGSGKIVFEREGIQFSGLLRRDRFIAYRDIRRVETLCRGITLEGVAIHLTDHDHHGMSNAPEVISQTIAEHETTSSHGETTRVSLAILRQHAPHANFIGPKWIEDGWVPRLGFALPHSPNPG